MSDFDYSKNLVDKLKLFESQFAEYESPIQVVMSEWETSFEDNCVKAVQSYGFNINKEELAKALNYDRQQYEKGFEDARRRFQRPRGEWLFIDDDIGWDKCSNCGFMNMHIKWSFCPGCGADMRGEE